MKQHIVQGLIHFHRHYVPCTHYVIITLLNFLVISCELGALHLHSLLDLR